MRLVIVLLMALCTRLSAQKPPAINIPDAGTRVDSSWAWVAEYEPPVEYIKWWAEIALCEKLPLPMDRALATQFFEVNTFSFLPSGEEQPDMAETLMPANQIFVGFSHIWREAVIKHEMVHLLLYWSGHYAFNYHFEIAGNMVKLVPIPVHPLAYYNADVGKCGITEHYQYPP